jgi:calcineurin-like phosphoesterase family protein
MLWGNHNNPIRKVYDREVYKITNKLTDSNLNIEDIYPLRYKNIIFCGDYIELVVNGQYIVMCHYPMDIFNEMRHGGWMLCGHSHGTYDKTRVECNENKRLDLSWDCHLKPLSFDEVSIIMSNKMLVAIDHHTRS